MRAAETVSYVAVTTTTDKYGDGTATDASPVSLLALVAKDQSHAQASIESYDNDAAANVVRKTLYLLDTTVEPTASDWFTVRGQRYEVDGESHRWGSKGVEVNVKRAEVKP